MSTAAGTSLAQHLYRVARESRPPRVGTGRNPNNTGRADPLLRRTLPYRSATPLSSTPSSVTQSSPHPLRSRISSDNFIAPPKGVPSAPVMAHLDRLDRRAASAGTSGSTAAQPGRRDQPQRPDGSRPVVCRIGFGPIQHRVKAQVAGVLMHARADREQRRATDRIDTICRARLALDPLSEHVRDGHEDEQQSQGKGARTSPTPPRTARLASSRRAANARPSPAGGAPDGRFGFASPKGLRSPHYCLTPPAAEHG